MAGPLYRGLVMTSTRILVSAGFDSCAAVWFRRRGGSDSVPEAAFRKTAGMRSPESVSPMGHTRREFAVSRVTTQFVTLREAKTCRNVEVAQIASVKWAPNQGDPLGDTLTLIAMLVIESPVLIPLAIVELLGHRGEGNPLSGHWESIPSPDGMVSRIEGHYGGGFVRRSVSVKKGRYELIGQDLHLTYDTSGPVETVPIQFDCDSLMLGGQKLSARLSSGPARPPIVGRWFPDVEPQQFLGFTESGRFEKRTAESQINGQIEKIKGGVRVKWLRQWMPHSMKSGASGPQRALPFYHCRGVYHGIRARRLDRENAVKEGPIAPERLPHIFGRDRVGSIAVPRPGALQIRLLVSEDFPPAAESRRRPVDPPARRCPADRLQTHLEYSASACANRPPRDRRKAEHGSASHGWAGSEFPDSVSSSLQVRRWSCQVLLLWFPERGVPANLRRGHGECFIARRRSSVDAALRVSREAISCAAR